MYTREILPPRDSPINDGNPVTGTWNRAFEKVDLLDIHNPYKYPLPRWVRNYKIKERQCFNVQDEHFMLEAIFCDFKLYRMTQILIYDKEKGEKTNFRLISPGTGWYLPKNLANSYVDNSTSSFYFRIHNWLDVDIIKLDIDIEARCRRPSLTVHLEYNTNSQNVTPIAVSLGYKARRIIYAYKTLSPVTGDIVLDGRNVRLNQDNCCGFFCDYKGFYPYHTQTIICSAMGFDERNRRFGFHIAENQTMDTNMNNENALWVDGKLTPLPSVHITMPNGPEKEWVIQDFEGMVDLTFMPREQNRSKMNFFITTGAINSTLGDYSGMLVDSEGNKIKIKNLFGMGEKINIRV